MKWKILHGSLLIRPPFRVPLFLLSVNTGVLGAIFNYSFLIISFLFVDGENRTFIYFFILRICLIIWRRGFRVQFRLISFILQSQPPQNWNCGRVPCLAGIALLSLLLKVMNWTTCTQNLAFHLPAFRLLKISGPQVRIKLKENCFHILSCMWLCYSEVKI